MNVIMRNNRIDGGMEFYSGDFPSEKFPFDTNSINMVM